MDLRDLAWFVALADSEHMTATAEELHISQPTLSRAVARLEREFGAPLFDRIGNKIHINRYGEVLYAHALRSLGELETAGDRIKAMNDPSAGTIALSHVTSYGSWLVADLVAAYQRHAPGAHFVLWGGAADEVLNAVRAGHADVAVTSPRPNDPSLAWWPLAREHLVAAVPAGHPFAHGSEVSLVELASEPLVTLRAEFGLRQICDAAFGRAECAPSIALEVTDVRTAWGMVAAGVGCSILPDLRRVTLDGVVALPINDHPIVRIAGLVHRSHVRVSPAVASFITWARERRLDAPDVSTTSE